MTKLLQTLVDALAVGSLYALIALGYTMVYGVLQFINFAHASIFMCGAWLSYRVARGAGWAATAPGAVAGGGGTPAAAWYALPAVLLAVMAACAALGLAVERLAYRPLRGAPRLNVLITAIGVAILLENVGQLPQVFGAQPVRMPPLIAEAPLATIAGVKLLPVDALVVVLALLLMAGLEGLVFRTRLGLAMRAVSADPRTAALMGVNVDRVVALTFALGSALAAAAGFLFASKYPGLNQPAHPTWVLLGLKAFVAAVVGGIGNLRGAMLGGLLIGLLELFGAAYFSPHLRDVYVFSVLILVLLVRPEGLLGRRVAEKV